jgi:probable rRNA maturation factor
MISNGFQMLKLDLQLATVVVDLPSRADLHNWTNLALQPTGLSQQLVELTIRVVDDEESQRLNHMYRGQDKPTNVLSFPFVLPAGITAPELGKYRLMGDLVISAPQVVREAASQEKRLWHHWAHLVIHGTLHLQGYDHSDCPQAMIMEQLETNLLAKLDIPNPYSKDSVHPRSHP